MIGFGERDQHVVEKKHWIYFPQQIPVLFLLQDYCHHPRVTVVTNHLARLSSGTSLLWEAFRDPLWQSDVTIALIACFVASALS